MTTARDKLLALATDKNAWPYPEQVTRLLDAVQADGMRDAAVMLRRHCPKHDAHSGNSSTAFMTCHCRGADAIDRAATALTAEETSR